MEKKRIVSNDLSEIIEIILYLIIALFSLRLFIYHTTIASDISEHISIIDKFIGHTFYIPHPGFHMLTYFVAKISGMSYNFVVPVLLTSSVIITILITKKLILWFLPEFQWKMVYVLVAVSLSFMTAIYFPWFNKHIYIGQWGPTIWHSPSMLLLKPLALLSFWGLLFYIQKHRSNQFLWSAFISFLLLGSTYTKPSFIICFIPALAVYLLVFHFKDFKLYFNVFFILLPSLLLLVYQFVETYIMHNTDSYFHDKIIFTNFGVMRWHSPNVVFSTLLALAFPLSVLFVINKKIAHNHYLLVSWLLVVIGFLQAGLLAEEAKFSQGAFIFGYIICLFILFVFSMIEYLSWYGTEKKYSVRPIYKNLVAIVGLAHLFSGIIYYIMEVKGITWL